jgi:hypothetical protein
MAAPPASQGTRRTFHGCDKGPDQLVGLEPGSEDEKRVAPDAPSVYATLYVA